jgi:DNA repair exonuclease SbcCD ATPase subunit
MSSTERSRRHRAKFAKPKKPNPELEQARSERDSALKQVEQLRGELARAKKATPSSEAQQRIAELEQQVSDLKTSLRSDLPLTVEELLDRRRQVKEERKVERAAKKVSAATVGAEREEEIIDSLLDKLEAKERQIKRWQTQARNERVQREACVDQMVRQGKRPLNRKEYAELAMCLHPDRAMHECPKCKTKFDKLGERDRLGRALALFNSLGLYNPKKPLE